ncbi:MAG: hypothetical protein WCJ56_09885 [bacterium]
MPYGNPTTIVKPARKYNWTLLTVAWMLPAMLVALVGGYLLAQRVVAPKYLQGNAIRLRDNKPIRTLSPDDASKLTRDEPSPVWTEGVRKSDLPKDAPVPTKKRTTTSGSSKPKAPEPEKPPADAPVDAPAADVTTTGN